MIFYSILFYLTISINNIFGLLEIYFSPRNECAVMLETEYGIGTCFNQQCSDYKDPWRVLNTHIENKPCFIHYLKLSFSNYDQLLVFIELQTANESSLSNFFDDKDKTPTMLEIEIDTIYPFNKNYFLSENMLNKLGGNIGNIHILQIEIKKWYQSSRSTVQFIKSDMITKKQPFKQITIYYQCNANQTRERLMLAKFLKSQEKSTCPSQIYIIPPDNFLMAANDNRANQPVNIYFDGERFIQPNLTTKPHLHHYKKKEPLRWSLFAKIGIVVLLIVLIVVFAIYHFMYARSQSTNQ